ncbi:MAG: phasin family protein [Pseudomonadota bacterium]
MAAAKDAAKKVETLAADAQKAATDQFEKITKSFEDVAAFNQDTFDAIVKSSNIAVKAVEEMNAEIVSFSKKTMEEGVAAAKEMSSIKTLPEFVEKQAEMAKTSMDDMMKQATKFNELYMAAAKDVMEPMNARATAAADLVKAYRV